MLLAHTMLLFIFFLASAGNPASRKGCLKDVEIGWLSVEVWRGVGWGRIWWSLQMKAPLPLAATSAAVPWVLGRSSSCGCGGQRAEEHIWAGAHSAALCCRAMAAGSLYIISGRHQNGSSSDRSYFAQTWEQLLARKAELFVFLYFTVAMDKPNEQQHPNLSYLWCRSLLYFTY